MPDTKRIIEFVFRVKTNGYQDELDDLMAYGQRIQEDMSGSGDLRESTTTEHEEDFYVEYIPEGSHWRDVTPIDGGWRVSAGEQTCLFIVGAPRAPFHPAAAGLPGGNKLSPPQPPQEDQ